jgi:hypothetical protein
MPNAIQSFMSIKSYKTSSIKQNYKHNHSVHANDSLVYGIKNTYIFFTLDNATTLKQ